MFLEHIMTARSGKLGPESQGDRGIRDAGPPESKFRRVGQEVTQGADE